MAYIDAHVHFSIDTFSVPAGIIHFLNSVEPAEWSWLATKAEAYGNIIPFFGIHPWFTDRDHPPNWESLLSEKLALQPWYQVGEIGIDRIKAKYEPERYPLERQVDIFTRQMEIAASHGRFVAVHCVRAWDLVLPILEKFKGRVRGIMHYFSGSEDIMFKVIDLGYFTSFLSTVYSTNSRKVYNAFMACPDNWLLLESDIHIGTNLQVIKDHYRLAAEHRKMDLKKLELQLMSSCSPFLEQR
jgi:TatD DNase family protein